MGIKVRTFWDVGDGELNEWIEKHVLKLIDIKFIVSSELIEYNQRVPVIKTKVIYEGVKK